MILEDEIIRIQSPCIIVKSTVQTKLLDLILMEQFVSGINTYLCPIKYIFIFDCDSIEKMTLEFLFYWMANKILLPQQYYLIAINRHFDEKTLAKKMEQLLNNESYEQHQNELNQWKECLVKALTNVINRTSKIIIVDDTLAIFPNTSSIELKICLLLKTTAFVDQFPINIKTIFSLQEQSLAEEWAEIRFFDKPIEAAQENRILNKFLLSHSFANDKMARMCVILCKNQSIQMINVQ